MEIWQWNLCNLNQIIEKFSLRTVSEYLKLLHFALQNPHESLQSQVFSKNQDLF